MHEAAVNRPWRTDAHAAGLVGLAHMTSHFFQMLLPPLYPWLMRDFGIGFTEAGFLATVFFVISSTGQAIAGFAVDRIGAFRVLLAGIGLLVLAGIALGLTQSYGGLVVTAALAGAGNAMFHPADFTILNRRVSASRLGHAFAMHGLSGNLGWAAGASFMGAVAAFAGWHAAGFAAAVVAAASWLFLLTRRDVLEGSVDERHAAGERHAEDGHPEAAASAAGGHFAFLGSTTVWLCFAFFFLSTGAGGILQNFAPAMLAHVYGVSLPLGTLCLTTYLLGSAAGTVLGGFVAGRERRSARVVAGALTVAATVSLLLASAQLPVAALLPAMFLLGCGSGTASPSRDLLVRQAATSRFGPASFGRVYGFVYSGLDSGLAIGPLAVGHILDMNRFQAGLLCIAVLQIGAVLVAVRVGRNV
jgi:FSR family fosmidomycin resistance protein-like MFS transporter